jgi:two-component system NarL family sensor kinase
MERTQKPQSWTENDVSQPILRRLPWFIGGLAVLLVFSGLILSVLAQIANGRIVTFSHQFFTPLFTITFCLVGGLVAVRHPGNPIGWMFCAIGLLSGINMFGAGYVLYDELVTPGGVLPGVEVARWLNNWIWLLGTILPITFPLLLFPDGRLLSPRWRPIAWIVGLGTAGYIFGVSVHPGSLEHLGITEMNAFAIPGAGPVLDVLLAVSGMALLIGIFGSVASVIIRYRRSSGIERAQVKWLAFAGIMTIVGGVVSAALWFIFPESPILEELSIVITDLSIAGVVLATGIAILRYRLWDIDILINRTLLYGALTVAVIALYVLVVGALGTVLQSRGSLVTSLLATGLVAVSFQPMRDRMQRGVNRMMFGERDEPYTVLDRLSERLEVVVASEQVLPTIVETVAQALKLPYAAITLKVADEYRVAAEYERDGSDGDHPEDIEVLPLIYQTETVGQLILAPRGRGETFSQGDRQLLETIARQAGIAAYNVRLAGDLQRSRERLVTTREEERRRLRRDLHDGLGPVLASVSFKLDAARNLVGGEAEDAGQLISEVKAQIQTALADIRRIAYNLRPPALDELGLVGALQEHITSQNQAQTLQIVLEAPDRLPALSAAAEVAIYRIVMEALTNVQRHAEARHCLVRLAFHDRLYLEVIDDGRGIATNMRAGVGLTSMRERAEEVGGSCVIESPTTGGTVIRVRLPGQAKMGDSQAGDDDGADSDSDRR